MATTITQIQMKRSETPGMVPSSLLDGEIAINLVDKKAYYGTPSGIQELLTPAALKTEVMYYVSPEGVDAPENGSEARPFATLSYALSQVTAGSNTNRKGITVTGFISDPGEIKLKPWVSIYGPGYSTGRIDNTFATKTIVCDPAENWASSRILLRGLHFTGTTGLNLDYGTITPSGSCVLDIDACYINGKTVVKGRATGGGDFVNIVNGSYLWGELDLTNITGYNIGGFVGGGYKGVATGRNVKFQFISSVVLNSFQFDASAAEECYLQFIGSWVDANIVANGTGVTLEVEADTQPAGYAYGITGAASVLRKTSADKIVGSHTGQNYTATSDNLASEHFAGIDSALGLRARRVEVPATATSEGQIGDYAVGGGYAYFCVAEDQWVRTVVASW